MKKIKPQSDTLLVLCSASLGGPTSSAINLLYLFRKVGRPIDVFLMDHEDVRTSDISAQGNLLPRIPFLADAITNRKNVKKLAQYVHRLLFIATHKTFGAERARKWLYKAAARRLSGKYKNVIAYQESMASDFVRYIETPNRIGWMHTDYDKLRALSPVLASSDVYGSYNHIASVTASSAKRMIEVLNRDPNTVHVIRNPLIPEIIIEKAREAVSNEEQKKRQFLIVSVGRLNPEKAFHRIPHVAKQLMQAGIDFDWYIIGDGVTRDKIESEIQKTETAEVVHLLGSKKNPYPYMRMADVLVITSEYEAQPMVANEALILDTPVVSTEFASVREVIRDGENGIIVNQKADAIFEALNFVLTNEQVRMNLYRAAHEFEYDNQTIIDQITSLMTWER